MTKEETKLWLRSYRAKKLEADHLDQMIKKLEQEIYNPKTTRFDKIPGSSHDAGSPTERLAIKHLDLVDKYKAMRDELLAEQMQIEEAIEGLNETERTLLRLYYMEGLKWEEVAVAINYSWRQTHNLHSNALDKLSEKPAPVHSEEWRREDDDLHSFEYGDDELGPY